MAATNRDEGPEADWQPARLIAAVGSRNDSDREERAAPPHEPDIGRGRGDDLPDFSGAVSRTGSLGARSAAEPVEGLRERLA
jgi:hypothetical protein